MRRLAAALLLSVSAAACTSMNSANETRPGMVAPVLTSADARDTFTFARPEIARVTHVDLDLALDFAANALGGTATLDVVAAPGAGELVLDSQGLAVTRVTDGNGRECGDVVRDPCRRFVVCDGHGVVMRAVMAGEMLGERVGIDSFTPARIQPVDLVAE